MDETPRQFIDELKSAILRRRIGQIAIAVVLAEECIRFLNAVIWYVIIPIISNILANQTESVLFGNNRQFPWIQLVGATLEFVTTMIFVFYVNRWIHGRNRPRVHEQEPNPPLEVLQPNELDEEPLVPRLLSAPYSSSDEESIPSVSVHGPQSKS
jgi:large-conductance mechanosensitive channel